MSVPSEATAGCVPKRLALSFVTTNETVCPDSLAGPGLMPVAHAATVRVPESSATVWSGPAVNEGGSLADWSVMVNVRVGLVSSPPSAVPPSSFRWTVTVVEPDAPGAGV